MIAVTRLGDAVQYFTTNVESVSFKKQVLQNRESDAEFMQDDAKARETVLAAQNSKLAQQWLIL